MEAARSLTTGGGLRLGRRSVRQGRHLRSQGGAAGDRRRAVQRREGAAGLRERAAREQGVLAGRAARPAETGPEAAPPHRGRRAPGHLGGPAELHPDGAEQRCGNHKLVNVLDDLHKKEQARATELLKAMPYAPTQAECERLRDAFAARYEKTDPKAVATLLRDWERMVTFYRFPKEHWRHLRTTNVVESPFSAVRLRTDASRRYKRVEGAQAMIWKLLTVAELTWRKLNAPELLPLVASGATFTDGVRDEAKQECSQPKPQPEAIAA